MVVSHSFDEDFEDYDPLDSDLGLDEEEVDFDAPVIASNIGTTLAASADARAKADAVAQDTHSPREKVLDLLGKMQPQKKILLGILDFCREPRSAAEVEECLAKLTEFNYCVYEGVELRRLLQEAEGLEYVQSSQSGLSGQDGRESQDSQDASATTEETELGEDGQEYLVIRKQEEGVWLSSAAALEIVDEQNPASDLKQLLALEPRYIDIYRRVMDACRTPRTAKELDALFNGDPVLQDPHRYSGYLVERLEKNGGLEWRGGWVVTELGLQTLDAAVAQSDKERL
jgi:hypothetical protein